MNRHPVQLHTTAEAMILLLMLGATAAWGYEGTRAWQIWALSLPAFFWLNWQGVSAPHHRTRAALVSVWCTLFILDAAFRAYLKAAYAAAPDSSHVLSAIANTQPREAWEYWTAYRDRIALSVLIVTCAVMLSIRLSVGAGHPLPNPAASSNAWRHVWIGLSVFMILLSIAGYASKPWRRWHPAIFWPQWAMSVVELRDGWSNLELARTAALTEAQQAVPLHAPDRPSTVVLVIADSINRDNMQIYGYPRATTPLLAQRRATFGKDLMIFSEAWSSKAGTLEALADLFEFGAPGSSATPHVLALARSAGYEVWWISNHDDLAIEQLHGRLAHEIRMVNRIPGRSTSSLDTAVLPSLQEALEDNSSKKLIVVHLLGAHPNYRLRYPSDMPTFASAGDAVDSSMIEEGRSWQLRQQRSEYDTAILFHDQILARTLDATIQYLDEGEYGAWMYLSDHGQEVGHDADRAGHSFDTPAGYKIPALIWQNQPYDAASELIAQRPFRSDWAAWTLTSLLNLQWRGHDPSRDILSPRYQWNPPESTAQY